MWKIKFPVYRISAPSFPGYAKTSKIMTRLYLCVVPQLKTSWLGRKSSVYARVTQPNNTPDPKGSCTECIRPFKENPRVGHLAVASTVEAYVKRSFRHHEKAEKKHVGGVLGTPEWTIPVSLRSRLPTSQYLWYWVGLQLTIRRYS